jgi:hypothetical protein
LWKAKNIFLRAKNSSVFAHFLDEKEERKNCLELSAAKM